jgi:hypothetical protein
VLHITGHFLCKRDIHIIVPYMAELQAVKVKLHFPNFQKNISPDQNLQR